MSLLLALGIMVVVVVPLMGWAVRKDMRRWLRDESHELREEEVA